MTEFKIAEYNETAAALAVLREKYCTVFDVTTTKGMDEAKKARAEVKGYRVALEKLRVELKAPALERTRLIDGEAKRITAELLAIEEPIDQVIKEEEKRKEEEKAAKARAEITRIAEIAAKISIIRNQVGAVANQPAAIISAELENAQALELSEAEFQEFLPDAQEALEETRKDLQAALNGRLLYEAEQASIQAEQEAEAARIKAEREELARLREAEAARLQAEREAQEAELKAKRETMEAELKAQREEQARQEQAARQLREAEEARLKAEREEQARKDEEIRQQQAAETARLKAEQEAMERQRAELEAKQRQIEEAAKFKKRGNTKIDPLADLKQALNANAETAKALDEAYQRGYQAGLNSTQQAA